MTTDPNELVAQFCSAWTRMDAEELAGYFTDDAVYHNIPMEPAVGKPAIRQFLDGMNGMISAIRFEVHRQIADGSVVMNERTDHITMGDRAVALPVVGVFEIRDGKIAAWRDYFDMGQFSGAGAG
ncbi:MAG TPA: limonene-1,2-epoxide hydrolase family protein [Acidimicrobiales bacterium]|jgi:limonene-1,2-epoxide hydrolase|nr:limonene-1,2-epoxide hydrolase family protein [Acidimicrobiales bacterium]